MNVKTPRKSLSKYLLSGHLLYTSARLQGNLFILPSVYQLAAQIKLIEGWKCTNIEQYLLKLELNNPNKAVTDRVIRTSSIKIWKDEAKTAAAKMSFSRDCARLWNVAPDSIKQASTLGRAKSEIKNFCKLLEL